MAEEKKEEKKKDKDEELEVPPKNSKIVIIVVGAVAITAILAGSAMFFAMAGKSSKETPKIAKVRPKIGPTMPVDNIIVNLDEPGGNRYLKLSFDMELTEPLDEKAMKLMPRFREELILYFSAKKLSDALRSDTKVEARKKIVEFGNKHFGKDTVKAVYLKDWVMQ